MKRDPKLVNKSFSRRVALLAGGQALLFSALAGRMYYLQVVESDRYRLMAEQNRVNLRLLPPLRGKILDRFGQPIAVNDPNYRVVVVPEQTLEGRDRSQTLRRTRARVWGSRLASRVAHRRAAAARASPR